MIVIEHNLDVIKSADWLYRHGPRLRCTVVAEGRRGPTAPREPHRPLPGEDSLTRTRGQSRRAEEERVRKQRAELTASGRLAPPALPWRTGYRFRRPDRGRRSRPSTRRPRRRPSPVPRCARSATPTARPPTPRSAAAEPSAAGACPARLSLSPGSTSSPRASLADQGRRGPAAWIGAARPSEPLGPSAACGRRPETCTSYSDAVGHAARCGRVTGGSARPARAPGRAAPPPAPHPEADTVVFGVDQRRRAAGPPSARRLRTDPGSGNGDQIPGPGPDDAAGARPLRLRATVSGAP